MGRGKKSSNKKPTVKLSPAQRSDISRLVDSLIKKCAKVPLQNSFSAKTECDDFAHIYKIVEQIRVLEKGLALPKYDRGEKLKAFFSWAHGKGIKASTVKVGNFGDSGYGLECSEDLTAGDSVLEVPVQAMMTEHTATQSYIGPMIERDPLLREMGNVRLAMHVLVEYLNPSSAWRPYVTALPQHFHTPLHFTPHHIRSISHSPVLESVVKQYRNIGRQYAYFYRIIHTLPEARDWPLREYFSYDAYRWAVCCVSTRINSVPRSNINNNGNKTATQLALVPCWDLVNHSNAQMSTDFLSAEDRLVCYANSSFSKGQQFTMHYGDRGNADLFLHSAFVVKSNPHDSVCLRLGLSKTDPLLNAKTRALSAVGLEGVKLFPVMPGAAPLSPQLWAFTVIFTAKEEFIASLLSSSDPAALLQRISTDAEHAELCESSYNFLHTRISLLLRAYSQQPTTTTTTTTTCCCPLTSLTRDLLHEEAALLHNALNYFKAGLSAGVGRINSGKDTGVTGNSNIVNG